MMLWKIKKLNKYKNYLFHLGSQHEIAYSLIILGKFIKDLLGANQYHSQMVFLLIKRRRTMFVIPNCALDSVFCC